MLNTRTCRVLSIAAIAFTCFAAPLCNQLQPANGVQPSAASGYTWQLVATGLSTPRSLQFDDDDNLWVLESGKGVTKHTPVDNGCLSLTNSTTIISDSALNHGLVVMKHRIIVSSSQDAYQMTLDQNRQAVVPTSKRTLVTNMNNGDHVTRTLLMVGNHSLVVSRGSDDNIDSGAADKSSGRAQIRMFDLSHGGGPFDYSTSGTLLGWGLRNDVGMALHPRTNGLFAVENSGDNLQRDGVDIHEDNPAEELNYLGIMQPGKMGNFQAKNYGYPTCFTAWNPQEMPANSHLTVGSPFALNSSNDGACSTTQAPRLSFQAHMAPLDIIFHPQGKQAWVSFHGSWDRNPPVGYGVALLDFNNGMPTQPSTSTSAAKFIFTNKNVAVCPGQCFRPVGLALDKKGRLWITSDATGEIYVLSKG